MRVLHFDMMVDGLIIPLAQDLISRLHHNSATYSILAVVRVCCSAAASDAAVIAASLSFALQICRCYFVGDCWDGHNRSHPCISTHSPHPTDSF